MRWPSCFGKPASTCRSPPWSPDKHWWETGRLKTAPRRFPLLLDRPGGNLGEGREPHGVRPPGNSNWKCKGALGRPLAEVFPKCPVARHFVCHKEKHVGCHF